MYKTNGVAATREAKQQMDEEDETLSHSGDSTGSEPDYDCSPESNGSECDNDDEETPVGRSAPRIHQRKSQNVAALLRFVSYYYVT